MIIGITGGSGVGKTTALGVLEELGAVIADCDVIYHELLESSDDMRLEIRARFPSAFEGGLLVRKKLGSIVFNNPELLDELNMITHKYVSVEIDAILAEKCVGRHGAIDAIALIESGISEKCDIVVGILAAREVRIERIIAREGIDPQYAASRIDSQKPDSFYIQNCDYTLQNDYMDISGFKQECKKLFTDLLRNNSRHTLESL